MSVLMKKNIGIILLAIGLACGAFALYLYFQQQRDTVSPVPDNRQIKIIRISPGA